MGKNPKVRRLGRIAKIPKATQSQDLHPGEIEPKYLETRWGPPTLSKCSQRRGARRTGGLELHQLQLHKSTGVSRTSCSGTYPLSEVLETSQRTHMVSQLWRGKQESLGREEKVRGIALGREGCVIVKRAFLCPGGRKRAMLASLLKAGARLNPSREGSTDGSEPGALGGSLGAPGQAREEGQGSQEESQGGSGGGCSGGRVGEPPGSPHPCAGLSHNALHGTSAAQPLQHRETLAPSRAAGCECRGPPGDKAKGAVGLLWLFPERNRTCSEKFASALRRQEHSVPSLLHHVLHKLRQRERTSAVDQRALESCHFLRHREKSQAQMKKHCSHHFK